MVLNKQLKHILILKLAGKCGNNFSVLLVTCNSKLVCKYRIGISLKAPKIFHVTSLILTPGHVMYKWEIWQLFQ